MCVCFFTQNLPIQTVDIHKIYWLVKIWFCFSKSWNEFLNIAKPTEWIGKHQFYISFNRFNRIFPIITFFSIVFILGALDNRKKKRKEVELFCPHNKCIIQMSTNHWKNHLLHNVELILSINWKCSRAIRQSKPNLQT